MADPTNSAPAAAPAPAPEAAAPAAAPISAPVAAEPVAAPVATETPAPAAAEPVKADPLKPATLLSDAKSPEAKPAAEAPKAEAPKEGEAKPAEAKPAEGEAKPPVEPLKFEALVLPEGVKLDDTRVAAFDEKFGRFAAENGLSPEAAAALRTDLVGQYVAEAQEAQQRMQQNQMDVWERTRNGWKEEFQKDPDIGGNRQETTLRNAGAVIERFGADLGANHEADFRMALRVTGAGDHPAVIRFVNWASQFVNETARPIAAPSKAPQPSSRAARRYGNTN